MRANSFGNGIEFGAVGKFEVVVVAKVEFEFEQRDKMEKLATEFFEFRREIASHLVERNSMSSSRLSIDEVGNGFGLREVEATIEEGTLSELARTSHASTSRDEKAKDFLLDVNRAVARDFDSVFACE